MTKTRYTRAGRAIAFGLLGAMLAPLGVWLIAETFTGPNSGNLITSTRGYLMFLSCYIGFAFGAVYGHSRRA